MNELFGPHQGRPRGAAGHRFDLPDRARDDGRAGRLAAHHVPDPRGQAVLGRGTYFPPAPRYGRPGFAQVLAGIAQSYREKPDAVAQNVAQLTQALARHATREGGGRARSRSRRSMTSPSVSPPSSTRSMAASRAPPSSPQLRPILDLLWRSYRRGPAERGRAAPRGDLVARPHEPGRKSTTISAAAMRATRPTRSGWRRISRRCSTTIAALVALLTQAWQENEVAALRHARRREPSAGSPAR